MDLTRAKPQERLNLCKKYFFIGLLGLPFLWLVNTIWFGQYVFFNDGKFESNRQRRKKSNESNDGGGQRPPLPNTRENVTATPHQRQTIAELNESTGTTTTNLDLSGASLRQRNIDANIESGVNAAPNRPTNALSRQPQQSAPEDLIDEKVIVKQIRAYVVYSFMGTIIWAVAIIAWTIVYQTNRAKWGEWGDSISFNIPRGIA